MTRTEMTEAQARTVESLRVGTEAEWMAPVEAQTARYGFASGGLVLLVLSTATDAPNPVVRLWSEGSAHLCEREGDYLRWIDSGLSIEAVERENDMAYVISPGGFYVTLANVNDLLARL